MTTEKKVDERELVVKIKKTLYVEQDLEKKLRIQAVLENLNESDMLNFILREHFNKLGEMKLTQFFLKKEY